MLRSSSILAAAALLGLVSTGCAAKVQARAGASWNAQSAMGTAAPVAAPTSPAPAPPVSAQPVTTGAAQPEIFGVPLAGAQDVVFVIDCSGSMSGATTAGTLPSTPFAAIAAAGIQLSSAVPSILAAPATLPSLGGVLLEPPREDKLQAAKAELIGALGSLPENTRFNIVYFNDVGRVWANGLLPMNLLSRVGSISFVHGIPARGTTGAAPALRLAYQSRPARVVFLSDGVANKGGNRNVVLAEARIEMRRGVRFDTVGLGRDQDAELLATMAHESGGVMVAR